MPPLSCRMGAGYSLNTCRGPHHGCHRAAQVAASREMTAPDGGLARSTRVQRAQWLGPVVGRELSHLIIGLFGMRVPPKCPTFRAPIGGGSCPPLPYDQVCHAARLSAPS